MTTEQNQIPHTIHDRGYKMLLSFWKVFQQLIEGFVEEDWKGSLDFKNSEKLPTEAIGKDFEKREADVLYKVPLLGEEHKEVYLYVLIEHQSSVDYMMAFRVLCYLMDIWAAIYKNADEKLRSRKDYRLPPVFPVVLYNGSERWTAATSVRDLIEHGHLLKEFIPNVQYHLVDVPRVNKEKLRQMKNILAAVFMLEQDTQGEEFSATYQEALSFANNETDEDIWKAFGEWVLMHLRQRHPEKVEQFKEMDFTKYSRQEVKTMLETMPDKLVAYGKEQGRLLALRESTQRILKARFGEVPGDIKEQLNAITSPDILDVLPEKAALAGSFEEFRTDFGELIEKYKNSE